MIAYINLILNVLTLIAIVVQGFIINNNRHRRRAGDKGATK